MKNLNPLFFICIIFLIWACTPPPPTKIDPNSVMVFPAPPEQPRIQFLRSYTSSADIEKPRWIDKLVESGDKKNLVIVKAYGVAIRDGKIYVGDSMLEGLDILDLKNSTFNIFRPLGKGTLEKPVNVALDAEGNLYIVDTQRKEVVIFDPELNYKDVVNGASLKPVDIAIMGDTLVIADMEDNNLEIWSIKEMKKLSDFPPDNHEIPDSLKLVVPISVAIDSSGNIYACDFGQFRVQKFDKQGKLIRSYGSIGKSLGQFARPKGIAVDREQRLFVVDAAFENIQIFDRDGKLLLFFGGSYERPGNMYLPAQVTIDYDNLDLFKPYVLPGYDLEYLILVSNQFGPDKIGVYGFINPTGGKKAKSDTKIIPAPIIKTVKDTSDTTNTKKETIKGFETIKDSVTKRSGVKQDSIAIEDTTGLNEAKTEETTGTEGEKKLKLDEGDNKKATKDTSSVIDSKTDKVKGEGSKPPIKKEDDSEK